MLTVKNLSGAKQTRPKLKGNEDGGRIKPCGICKEVRTSCNNCCKL